MKQSYYYFILLIILSFYTVNAQSVASIHCVEYPNEHRILFGAFANNDKNILHFYLKSLNTTIPLIMENTAPTLILDASANSTTPNDYFSFSIEQPDAFPIILNDSNPAQILEISFLASNTDSKGRKEARLILGFTDNSTGNLQPIFLDTFYIIGKNTTKQIDGYDDYIYFDSVFINQHTPIQKEWQVRNTTKSNLNATSQSFTLLSQPINGNEFTTEQKQYPLTFYPGNFNVYHSWNFTYKPLDIMPDTALMLLTFSNHNGTADTAKVKLFGIGVTHNLQIADYENCTIYSTNNDKTIDTIDIGNVRVGSSKQCKVSLRNIGNINYGLLSQVIYDEVDDVPYEFFALSSPFCTSGNIPISNTDSFAITFTPNRKGDFFARYIITNNFNKRGIKSNDSRDFTKSIILRGTGVQPILDFIADTLDFGSVSYANTSQYCLSQADTLITLRNIGNSELIIYDIASTDHAFVVTPTSLSIPANGQATLQVSFTATPPERNIIKYLIFTSNATKLDSLCLIARSVPPIAATLALPKVSNKPGTPLILPITLLRNTDNTAVANYANSFSFHIRYNPTILVYDNYTSQGTASEGAAIININEQDGTLRVTVNTDAGYFYNNDTLIVLQFRTYLGNMPNTELAIQNAKLGISNCDDYINLTLKNGLYSIDSVCGLPYKHYDLSDVKFNVKITSTSVTNSIELSLSLPYSAPTTTAIYNTLGDELLTDTHTLPIGDTTHSIDISDLPNGIYLLRIYYGTAIITERFIKQ